MPADNDALMLQQMADAIIGLQLKYRASSLSDRLLIRPTLEQLLTDYSAYQMRLLKEGVITTEGDLAEMKGIAAEIDEAANKQKLIAALARTVGFVAARI